MAVTTNISYIVKDGEDDLTRHLMYYDSADVNTVADAQGIATTYAPLFEAISDCRIIGAEVTFSLTVPAPGSNPAAGSRNDAGATLSFYQTAGRAFSIFVPGWKSSLMANKLVNAAGAGVQNFLNAITNGGGITGGLEASDPNALDLTTFVEGKQSTRKKA